MQNIIKYNTVRQVSPQGQRPVSVAHPTEAAPKDAAPGVRLHRADGRVHAIEVTCACGETKLIELAYTEKDQ
ncbi:MAG: hypothetical protein ACI8PQ_001701 [Planctomycetota bacterium]|jgi:hypothetical protein